MERRFGKLLTEDEIKARYVRAVIYKHTVIKETRQCLLCNKRIVNLSKKIIYWETMFTISMPQMNMYPSIDFFTICPKCRIKPIGDIYKRIIDRKMDWRKE